MRSRCPRTHRRLGRVPPRHLRLHPGPAGAQGRELPGGARARRSRWSARRVRASRASMALIHRFYDVTAGEVLVGGHDVRADHASVARPPDRDGAAGAVPVHRHGASRTSATTRTDATREEVIAAAQAVGAHDFILRLPHGYDTRAERARQQPLDGPAPAHQLRPRAGGRPPRSWSSTRRPPASTATPSRTIQKALAVLLKGRTGLVIAHRLATIRNADRIIVLQRGPCRRKRNSRRTHQTGWPLRRALQIRARLLR